MKKNKILVGLGVIVFLGLTLCCLLMTRNESSENGFNISNGVLKSYTGEDSNIIIPSNVTKIGENAFAGDFNRGVNLYKVIIPGTVKQISNQAFAFTNADIIIIEPGVESIGEYAFMDASITEIYIPSTVKKIGSGCFSTEEPLDGTKVHVAKGSYAEKELQDAFYGDVKIIADYE